MPVGPDTRLFVSRSEEIPTNVIIATRDSDTDVSERPGLISGMVTSNLPIRRQDYRMSRMSYRLTMSVHEDRCYFKAQHVMIGFATPGTGNCGKLVNEVMHANTAWKDDGILLSSRTNLPSSSVSTMNQTGGNLTTSAVSLLARSAVVTRRSEPAITGVPAQFSGFPVSDGASNALRCPVHQHN